MKNLILVFTILLPAVLFAQTADEIITKHLEATGGKTKWEKVNSMTLTGFYVMGPGMNAPTTEVMMTKPFKGFYQDFSWQGMTSITAMREDTGWSYSPWGGKRVADPLSPNDIRSLKLNADPQGLLCNYASKGYSTEYLGTDDVDGIETYKVRLNTVDGDMVYFFFDTETYNLVKSVRRIRFDDREEKSYMVYSDFRKLPFGITVPFSFQGVDENGNEQGGPVNLEKVEVNTAVDEKIFNRPTNTNP